MGYQDCSPDPWPVIHDLPDQHQFVMVHRYVHPIIHHQAIQVPEILQDLLQTVLVLCFNQLLQQVEVSYVPGLVPEPAGRDCNGAAEVGRPALGTAVDDDECPCIDKSALRE